MAFGAEGVQVERVGEHREFAVWRAGPVGGGAVAVEFDAVLVGIAQVDRFAHAVVGRAVDHDARGEHAVQRVRQRGAIRVKDRGVVESGRAGRGRTAAAAFPGVESDVVVVAAGGNERGLRAEALGDFEPEHTAVEGKGSVEVGDLEVDVTDADGGMERGHGRE